METGMMRTLCVFRGEGVTLDIRDGTRLDGLRLVGQALPRQTAIVRNAFDVDVPGRGRP